MFIERPVAFLNQILCRYTCIYVAGLAEPGCFHTSYYSVLPFDRWLIGPVFICMDQVHFCMGMFQSGRLPVCHLSVFRIVILCFISVVLGGGVSGRWWGVGPVLMLSGFLRVVCLSGTTLVH